MCDDRGAIAPCVWNGDHKGDGPASPLRHRRSLELSCSQLCLEVEKRSLHLDRNHSSGTIQHHVDCPPVRRSACGNLQPNPPRGRCRGSDQLGDLKLPGVAQADTIGRIKAKDEVMATGSCKAIHHAEAGHDLAALSLADQSLGYASSPRQLRLGQTRYCASSDELVGEAGGHLVGAPAKSHTRSWHAPSIG